MQIMAGTPQMKLFTALLMDAIIASIMCSPFILFSGGMDGGKKHIRREDYENQVLFHKIRHDSNQCFFLVADCLSVCFDMDNDCCPPDADTNPFRKGL